MGKARAQDRIEAVAGDTRPPGAADPAMGRAAMATASRRRFALQSNHVLQVDTGSLYPALHRLERQGSITAEWKTSENNQRTRVYRLTPERTQTAGRGAIALGAVQRRDRPASCAVRKRRRDDVAGLAAAQAHRARRRDHGPPPHGRCRPRCERRVPGGRRTDRASRVRQRHPRQGNHPRHVGMATAVRPRAGCRLCQPHTQEGPRLHIGGRAHAGARNRHECGDVQHYQRGSPETTSLSRRGSARLSGAPTCGPHPRHRRAYPGRLLRLAGAHHDAGARVSVSKHRFHRR